ncbi:MAG: bifunctional sugar-1-phosphate nucleotidylyltransferase/acetyltransferase, partial [archaeon]|nr:bifunctional sugar-1-phosphate nucleotidylyltransferase/acetyltransferase [archaeon]
MQAVLLAAGKGVRVMPFTCTRPKPMIPVANKPILQHDIEQLEGLVDEVILVVGYLKEKIQDYFGTVFNGMKITYVEQKEYLGTGHALLQAEKLINGKFIVMYGDDLYHCDDIKSCLAHDLCVLVKNVANPGMFGIINSQDGKVADIVEKPENPESNLANTGLYVFDKSIFPILESVSRSKRGEYELTDAVLELSKLRDIYCETVRKSWIPMGYLHNILDANEIKVAEVFEAGGSFIDKNSVVEDGAVLKGDVKIGSGTVVRAGTYIEGPCIIGENSKIGPNAYIRSGTVIGDNCHIGASVEL